jgi:hypothetical protein
MVRDMTHADCTGSSHTWQARRRLGLALALFATGALAALSTGPASGQTGTHPEPEREHLVPVPVERIDALGPITVRDAAWADDGDLVVVGEFSGTVLLPGGTQLLSAGGVDGVVVRYAPDGSVEHAVRFGGAGTDRLTAVDVGPDGAAIAGGQLEGSGTMARPGRWTVQVGAAAGTSPALVAIAATGEPSWRVIDVERGGAGTVHDVAVGDDGTVLVGGSNLGPLSLGGARIGGFGWRLGFVGRLDTGGSVHKLVLRSTQHDVHRVALGAGGAAAESARNGAGWTVTRSTASTLVPQWTQAVSAPATYALPVAIDAVGRVLSAHVTSDATRALLVRFDVPTGARVVAPLGDAATRPRNLATTDDGTIRVAVEIASASSAPQQVVPLLATADQWSPRRAAAYEVDDALRVRSAVATEVSGLNMLTAVAVRGDGPIELVTKAFAAGTILTDDAAKWLHLPGPGGVRLRGGPTPSLAERSTAGALVHIGGIPTGRTPAVAPLSDGTAVLVVETPGQPITIEGLDETATLTPPTTTASVIVRLDRRGRVIDARWIDGFWAREVVAGESGSIVVQGYASGAALPLAGTSPSPRWGDYLVVVDELLGTIYAAPASQILRDEEAGQTLSRYGGQVYRVGSTEVTATFYQSGLRWIDDARSGQVLYRTSSTAQMRRADGTVAWTLTGASANGGVLGDAGIALVSSPLCPQGTRHLNGVPVITTISDGSFACLQGIRANGTLAWHRTLRRRVDSVLRQGDGLAVVPRTQRALGEELTVDPATGVVVGAEADGWNDVRRQGPAGDRPGVLRSPAGAWALDLGDVAVAEAQVQIAVTGTFGPIEGARVDAVRRFPKVKVVAAAVAGADGVATFTLPPGSYSFRVSDPSGVHQTQWIQDAPVMSRSSKHLLLPGAQLDLAQALPSTATGSIGGLVTDDTGAPAAGAVVWLFDDQGVLTAATVGVNGGFTIAKVPAGSYDVFVSHPGQALVAEWWKDASTRGAATEIVVGADPIRITPVLHRRVANLSVEIVGSPDQLRIGQRGMVHAKVTNNGPEYAALTEVHFTVDPNLEAEPHAPGVEVSGDHWELGLLAPNSSRVVTLDVTVLGPTPDPAVVTFTVSTASIDGNAGDDTTQHPIDIIGGERPDDLWATTIHGPGDVVGYGVEIGDDGSTYVTGWFTGTVTFGPGPNAPTFTNNRGAPDMFFLKLAPGGALEWVQRGWSEVLRIDPTGAGIAVDSQGNLYVSGFFEQRSFFTGTNGTSQLVSSGAMDGFLLKYSPDGALLWARKMGWTGSDYAWTVRVDNQDNAIVSGGYAVGFRAAAVGAPSGTHGGFLLAYNGVGEIVGSTFIASLGGDEALVRDHKVLPDGSVVAVGSFAGTMTVGTQSRNSAGGLDGYLVHLQPLVDHTPGVLGLSIGGSSGYDRFTGVAPVGDGTFMVTGRFDASAVVEGAPVPATGQVLLRAAPSAVPLWMRPLNASLRKIVVSPNGSFLLFGAYQGTYTFETLTGPETIVSAGSEDGLVLAFDANGLVSNWASYGGADRDVTFGMDVGPDGHLHLTGTIIGQADVCRGPDSFRVEAEGVPNSVIARCTPLD